MKPTPRSHAYAVGVLALVLAVVAEIGQLPEWRQPGREDNTWRSLNNYSMLFLETWRQKGLLSSRLALEIPLDGTDFRVSKPYSSYPSTYLLPAYVATVVAPAAVPPNPMAEHSRLRWLARANHLALSIIAGLTTLALAGSLVQAFSAVLASSMLPPFLIFQHNLWWPDLAGLTISALFFHLHLRSAGKRKFLPVLGLAAVTDWFGIVLGGFIALGSGRKQALRLGALLLAVIGLLVFQQYLASGLNVMFYKLRVRTGVQAMDAGILPHIRAWPETLRLFLGLGGLLLPPVFIAGAALIPEGRRRLKAFWPLVAAVGAHWLLLSNHYPSHYYNTVRWAYLLALLPALIPGRFGAAAALCLALWSLSLRPLATAAFDQTTSDLPAESLEACRLVERHHAPSHFFVSAEFSFSAEWMGEIFYLPWCRSLVSRANSSEEITNLLLQRFLRFHFQVEQIQRNYFLAKAPPAWAPGASEVDREGAWRLYELSHP